MKYLSVLLFLLTHDTEQLKKHWQHEIIGNKKFAWHRIFNKCRNPFTPNVRYWFWWRLANEMFATGNKHFKKTAGLIQKALIFKYNVEIMFGAKIGMNPTICHFSGIVITGFVDIGDNFTIRQNTTIGVRTLAESHGNNLSHYSITIGKCVSIGASSCIIADNITIGDNVNIGAMSFINKDIPRNTTVFTRKTNELLTKPLCS